MSSRKNASNPFSDTPHARPSGLTQAAFNNNRDRGFSAIPEVPVVSPTMDRAVEQRQMSTMTNSTYGNGGSGTQSASNGNSRAPASSQYPAHNRDPSSSAHSNQSHGSNSPYGGAQVQHNHGSSVSTNTSNLTVAECSQFLQTSLTQLQQKVKAMPGIAGSVQDAIIGTIRDMSQSYNEKQRNLQRLWDKLQNENSQLNQQLDDARRQLKDVNQTNSKTARQRDAFQAQINKLLHEQRQKQQEWERAEQAYKREIESMKYQLTAQEEQLKGKRALWMNSNPTSSARRDAMSAVRDPFHSPTTNQMPTFDESSKKLHVNNLGGNNFGGNNFVDNFGGGAPSHMDPTTFAQAPSNKANYGPPPRMDQLVNPPGPPNKTEANKLRRQQAYETLPVGKARPSSRLDFSLQNEGSNMMPRTEVGGSGGSEEKKGLHNVGLPSNNAAKSPSQALVLLSTDDPPEIYTSEFATIYHMIEGWVKTYGNLPNLVNDQAIARSNHDLWSYMMNLTYPGKAQDSHSHVMLLLNDRKVRFWFVMRMYVSYLVWDVISIKTFYGFDPRIDQTLDEVKAGLQVRGLNNERRQHLIDLQSRAIQNIVGHHKWQEFRSAQLAFHSKRLRELLGPMLNDGCARFEAGKDIGGIAIRAFDLSAKMHTSHLTFQVYFPETASKFSAATMMAKDQPNTPGMQLQINQTRLKLVITPVITMRDDRGTTIKAKNLHHSTVLTMG